MLTAAAAASAVSEVSWTDGRRLRLAAGHTQVTCVVCHPCRQPSTLYDTYTCTGTPTHRHTHHSSGVDPSILGATRCRRCPENR